MGIEAFMTEDSHKERIRRGMRGEYTEVNGSEIADKDITHIAPMHQLLWDLREYGFPIAKDTVELVTDYLIENDLDPADARANIIAQALEQSHKMLEFETNNVEEVSSEEKLPESPYWKAT